jgi:hypothetical protein
MLGFTVGLELVIPEPNSLLALFWFLLAISAGQSFKDADQQIQGTEWFNNLPGFWQWLVKSLLDFTHHWWMGLFMVVYAYELVYLFGGSVDVWTWFGWGLFADDLPDVPRRYGIKWLNTPPEED